MQRKHRLAIAVSTAVLSLNPSFAYAIDLLESYRLALAQDADYRAAQAQADSDREVVPIAIAKLLPSVSAGYTKFQNDLTTRSQVQNYDSRYPSNNLSLTVNQPLYRPSEFAGYQQSKAKLEGVEAMLIKAQQDASLRVSTAYFNAILATEGLNTVLAAQKAIATQLQAAKMALAAGQGTRTEVDEAQARLDINQAQEITARQQIDQNLHQLAILVNQPVKQVSAIHASRLELKPMNPDSVDQWIGRAEAASPDLRNLRAQVEADRIEIDRAQAGHKPTLDFIAQYTNSKSDNITNPDFRYTNNQIGVRASVPLFSGGSVSAQVRSAMASFSEGQERLESARRKLGSEVRKQFQAVREGVAKVRAMEQAERSAEQAVISSQKGFEAGTRTRLDILNSENQRAQTRSDLAKERVNYVLARLQLLALAGDLSVDEITMVNGWLSANNPGS